MNFEAEIILENEVAILRPLTIEDTQLLQGFVKEADIWKFTLSKVQTQEDFQHYIQSAIDGRNQKKEYPFIVYDKIKQDYAGSTRFYDIQLANKTLLIGYTWYGKAFQGTKLNKNCKFLLLQYAFEVLGMERVEFRADNRNERSKQAMLSIGCTIEGVLRNHLPTHDGGRRDSVILSILKDEWYNVSKKLLLQKIEI